MTKKELIDVLNVIVLTNCAEAEPIREHVRRFLAKHADKKSG